VSNVTRLSDALNALMHAAKDSADIELIPWVQKELCKLAMRHFDDDVNKAAKLLGIEPELLTERVAKPPAAEKKLKRAV
jgi:hypothetical protein